MALGDYSGGSGGLFGAAGELLGQQVQDETEEMKRRRQLLQQMQEAVSPLGASSMLGLPSAARRLGRLGGVFGASSSF